MERLTFLQMSVSGGVIILFTVLIRALLLHKLPKKTFLVLWCFCLLRLMLPFSVPSILSVYNLVGTEPVRQMMPVSDLPAAVPAAPVPVTAVGQSAPPASSVSVWGILWAIGAVVSMTVFACVYIRCRLRFRESPPVEGPFIDVWRKSHPLRRKMEIRTSEYISAPLTYGLFRPVILMPEDTDWEDTDRLAYMLEHEYVHIRRFDAGVKLLYVAAACVHWFNPLVWVMLALVNRDMELSCDETVMRVLGMEKKKMYAKLLIDMEEKGIPSPFSSSFSKNAVEERIVAIMKLKKKSLLAVILAAGLTVGAVTALGTSAYADQKTYNDAPTPSFTPSPVPEAEYYEEYQRLGIEIVGEKQIFYYNGQEVRYFLDGIETDGNEIAKYTYFNEKGTIDLHTIWEEKENGDGSIDPMYKRLRIEPYSQEEFDARDIDNLTAEFAGTWIAYSDAVAQGDGGPDAMWAEDAQLQEEQSDDWAETLAPYLPFGLTYQYDWEAELRGEYALTMWYQGREVRGIYDETAGTWITEHAGTSTFSADAGELYAVYTDGKMSGLRFADEAEQEYWDDVRKKTYESIHYTDYESREVFDSVYETTDAISSAAVGFSIGGEEGETIAERFAKYASYGVTYEEKDGCLGNAYLNGKGSRPLSMKETAAFLPSSLPTAGR